MTVACELDDACIEVVVDLSFHFVLDGLFQTFGIRDEKLLRLDVLFFKILSVIPEDLVETGFLAGDVVPVEFGTALERG